jgi:predicted HAD superfamily Cof-like phosphohydrolase
MNREDLTKQFMIVGNQKYNEPLENISLLDFRWNLIYEEVLELCDVVDQAWIDVQEHGYVLSETKEKLLKEGADCQYVLSGLFATFNLPLEEAFKRVHESNMSKLRDGEPSYRADGKIEKGEHYTPPDLGDLV